LGYTCSALASAQYAPEVTKVRSFLLATVGSVVMGLTATGGVAAQSSPVQQASATAPAAAAALVNGQPVSETAVQRALKRVPPTEHAKARPEILDFLIDNLLIEQHLLAQKIAVDPKEVETRIGEIKGEMAKQKQDFAKMLQELNLTEAELRSQIAADLRWEKFALAQANDAALKQMFDKNTEMFDGSMVRARHVLITPASPDPKAVEQVRATLTAVRKEVQAAGDAAAAGLPPTTDPMAKEQARARAMEAAFAKAAEKYSACPSKKEGGDISWFPRAGSMVEPFARAAFALKPYELSDVVATPFGLHLIMVTGRKPGVVTTYDKVKDEVREVYCGQLREGLCRQLRQSAKITVTSKK